LRTLLRASTDKKTVLLAWLIDVGRYYLWDTRLWRLGERMARHNRV